MATTLPGEVGVLAHNGDGAGLLELWKGVDAVVLVDCVRSGERPGTIHRLDASSAPVAPAQSHGSSHAISVTDAIELARTLGRLPGRVVVYGLEGATLEAGSGLSAEVARVLDGLVAAIHAEALTLRLAECSESGH